MYADRRSAINSLQQANDLCDKIDSTHLGVIVDVYHLWWDPKSRNGIQTLWSSRPIFAFQICDWKTPTLDLLNDRGLMGEGCINIPLIRNWVEESGFTGYHEVEFFSTTYWRMDQTKKV